MDISIQKSKLYNHQEIKITGSKSESNRLLLLQALYPQININNLSNSDDSVLMQKALATKESIIDIHHAGTAMRFLTAYLATQNGEEVVITGSSRMKERPIKILVDALLSLGADISYVENEGFPPLKIIGKKLSKHKVSLEANVSSQYISALLLIASKLDNGLELTLNGKITSVPYIKMTLSLLNEIGVETSFVENKITVKPNTTKLLPQTLVVESDWSSASYFYSIIALSDIGTEITISSYKKHSLQGDSVLAKIYQSFGVATHFDAHSIRLVKVEEAQTSNLEFHLSDAPDIAQTIAVTAFGLGVECYMTGLHTLKIKETDRLVALKVELEKLGAEIDITEASLKVNASKEIKSDISINTYNDHRMAMAFAPLGLKTSIIIKNADVVSKSYPQFWEDFKEIGFNLK
ncbi:3-phosphoshikimate 1-carboxyvinyltransferase [Winogradskyella echinorum]|uniref:3-phosphoshikimate 1-carboxyvinyltransferase n=1 Tax=Winogradskyella echinorum TaxID=538189 RepID=A0ABR6Y476_9FLAO|nr:3-phosphoshikimate 1-carboxyvinyltransferase [Winogradskyella echinorum]MBC3847474.1 3-phosphoshikimate 1-carboxyvinyltransferase [Winogradskyella echinorum]MBC5751822.1 3-phosphoshikimate 1-carboxyvinyltransferase [Winogradskyella echinorum]